MFDVAQSSEDPKVLAGAFNGLGDCLFKQEKWTQLVSSWNP